jgi:hypothetical protein
MKEIINKKVYDTEQAEEIAQYTNGGNSRDFGFIRETLYKTQNGNYFLHGRGGAKTKYSVSGVYGTSGGQEIRTMDKEECLNWAEKRYVDTAAIINEFEDDLEQA